MHPLCNDRRRRLVAASLRLERCIRREHYLPREVARRRLIRLLRHATPWDWYAL
jgi:hypothetical protein